MTSNTLSIVEVIPEPATAIEAVEGVLSIAPAQLFSQGSMDAILERIQQEVRAVPVDISTEAGRKACASLAYKVARSKSAIEEARKNLVSAEKQRLARIDAEGKRARDILDALKKEVRAPLDEYEAVEEARVAEHEAALGQIQALAANYAKGFESAESIRGRLATLDSLRDRSWQEFTKRATQLIDHAEETLRQELVRAEQREQEAKAEQERLERERLEREKQERQAREEAAARRAEELAAKKVREAEERAAKAERAREKAIADAAAEAERQRALAERREREKEAIAAANLKLMEERAARAAEVERRRQIDEQAAEAAAEAARAADREHRKRVHTQALKAFVAAGIDRGAAFKVITLIARGAVPGVTIAY